MPKKFTAEKTAKPAKAAAVKSTKPTKTAKPAAKVAKVGKTVKVAKNTERTPGRGRPAAVPAPKGTTNVFGESLRKVRESAGLTMQATAEMLGMSSNSSIARLESEDYRSTSLATMQHIAHGLNCELVCKMVPKDKAALKDFAAAKAAKAAKAKKNT